VDQREWKAFEEAALEHLEALYGYARSLVRNPTEAEDLVQETYLRGMKAARESTPAGNLKAWLFTILRHLWINDWRRRCQGPDFVPLESARPAADEPMDWITDERHRPDVILEQQVLRDQIRTAIENLADGFREVIVLRYIEGFSYNQIAQILGCPAGTVMSRLSRARAELRRQLLHHMDEPHRRMAP
jgi:RNA polymerase sigma-70 factor (ECF subfamily)